LLQQKNDFTDDDIDGFQGVADVFFANWLELVGYDGVTNYMHVLGAGHIRYYLVKWRNLDRYQNQGWESYNQMIAAFWHHRTTKGGSKYGDKSKIKPIGRWILRLMLWKTGVAQEFFRRQEEANSTSDEDDDDDSYYSD
jgi:hypothetical protein